MLCPSINTNFPISYLIYKNDFLTLILQKQSQEPKLHDNDYSKPHYHQSIYRISGGLKHSGSPDMLSGLVQQLLHLAFDIVIIRIRIQLPDTQIHSKINLQFFLAVFTSFYMLQKFFQLILAKLSMDLGSYQTFCLLTIHSMPPV